MTECVLFAAVFGTYTDVTPRQFFNVQVSGVLLPGGWGAEMLNGIHLPDLPPPRTARSVDQEQDKDIPRPAWVPLLSPAGSEALAHAGCAVLQEPSRSLLLAPSQKPCRAAQPSSLPLLPASPRSL